MKWSQSKSKGEQTEVEPLAKPKDVTGAAEEEPISEKAVDNPDLTEFPYRGRKKYLCKKHGRTLKYIYQELQQA